MHKRYYTWSLSLSSTVAEVWGPFYAAAERWEAMSKGAKQHWYKRQYGK